MSDDLSLTCSDCGHEHVNGNSGSCSKFTCDCREWVAPIAGAAPVTARADDTRPRPVKGL